VLLASEYKRVSVFWIPFNIYPVLFHPKNALAPTTNPRLLYAFPPPNILLVPSVKCTVLLKNPNPTPVPVEVILKFQLQ